MFWIHWITRTKKAIQGGHLRVHPAPTAIQPQFPAFRRFVLDAVMSRTYSPPIDQRNKRQGTEMITAVFTIVTAAYFFALAADVIVSVTSSARPL